MILLGEELSLGTVGAKTENIWELHKQGVRVPKSLAFSAEEVTAAFQDRDRMSALVEAIPKLLPAQSYAIRSSSLIEDTLTSSQAGQFLTRVNILPQELLESLDAVIEDAHKRLEGDLATFSVLIQEFIPADLSGVTFTRHPVQGIKMVIETSKGDGYQLVSGRMTPERKELSWDKIQNNEKIFCQIEEIFGYPQDIEWCLSQGELYILQSRPITSLSPDQLAAIQYQKHLETTSHGRFLLKKGLCEQVPRPTPLMFSLIQRLHAEDGPVRKVYQESGVDLENPDWYCIRGNELFVDEQKELKAFFPCLSWVELPMKGKLPLISSLKGARKSLRNACSLRRMKVMDAEQLMAEMTQVLNTPLQGEGLSQLIQAFMEQYKLVVKAGLLATQLTQRRESEGKQQWLFQTDETLWSSQWKGNGLNIADESPFKPVLSEISSSEAIKELARWLTVRGVHTLREALKEGFPVQMEDQSVYFASLDEISSGSWDQKELSERQLAYGRLNAFSYEDFSQSLSLPRGGPQGVSPGRGEGLFIEKNQLSESRSDQILFTEVLSPDLISVFPFVKGIVSTYGGMLSHLSILAREHKIPVVSGFRRAEVAEDLGKCVSVDGHQGVIKSIT